MPFAKNSDLPKDVRDVLPARAQMIFRETANESFEEGLGDEDAFKSAWTAVGSAGYKKRSDGKYRIEKEGKRKNEKVKKDHYGIDGTPMSDAGFTREGTLARVEERGAKWDKDASFYNGNRKDNFCGSCAFFLRGESGQPSRCMAVDGDIDPLFSCVYYISASVYASYISFKIEREQFEAEIEISSAQDIDEFPQILKTTDEEDPVAKTYVASIQKRDDEKQILTGVVLEPDAVDSQGDFMTADDIEESAHDFMMRSRAVGLQHVDKADAEVVESFITPGEMLIGEETVRKGAWVMSIKIHAESLWGMVKKGELTGLSVGGYGIKD